MAHSEMSLALPTEISSSAPDYGGSALHVNPLNTPFIRIKALVERGVGVVLLILSLPLMAVLVLTIRLTSRGPAIYRQVRTGRGGRHFTMYKLRSMRCDAEVGTGPVWASNGRDPRVTALGHWLRKLHLDELPQLFNVASGEMSLVGPRPERPEFVSILAAQIPGYVDRLQVLPGITGLAQINLPPDTDLDSVRRKLVLDQEYIDTAGVLLDLRIATCTLVRLVGLRGGPAVALLGLKRAVALPSSPTATIDPPDSPTTTISVPVSRRAVIDPPAPPRREGRLSSEATDESRPRPELAEAQSCVS